ERVVVADDRVLVDLAVRRPGADPEVVVGLDDPVEAAHVLEVDQHAGLTEPQLEQGDQAVPTGEELCLALSLVEDPDRLVEAPRAHVLERTRNHPGACLPPRVRGVWPAGFVRASAVTIGPAVGPGSWVLGVVRPGSALGNRVCASDRFSVNDLWPRSGPRRPVDSAMGRSSPQ